MNSSHTNRPSFTEFIDINRLDAVIYHLQTVRASWRAIAKPQRIDALRVAALSLGNIADRQLPAGERQALGQPTHYMLMGVIALIASTLAYTVGVEQGRAQCLLRCAVAPTVVR